jgi:fructokinase
MEAWGLDTAGLQVDAEYPTGLVDISFEGKHHTFDILANRAYDHLDAKLSEQAIAGADSALAYHGTLILRTQELRQVLDRLLAMAGMPVFVDVNLRDPWWRENDLPPLLERARWVKVNDEELNIVANRVGVGSHGVEETARRFRATYELDMLIVTLGRQGALAFDVSNDAIRVEPEQDTEIVDTVGAGDAFSSVVLFGLLEGWSVPQIMRKAQAFASRICAQRGATSEDIGLYKAMRF